MKWIAEINLESEYIHEMTSAMDKLGISSAATSTEMTLPAPKWSTDEERLAIHNACKRQIKIGLKYVRMQVESANEIAFRTAIAKCMLINANNLLALEPNNVKKKTCALIKNLALNALQKKVNCTEMQDGSSAPYIYTDDTQRVEMSVQNKREYLQNYCYFFDKVNTLAII